VGSDALRVDTASLAGELIRASAAGLPLERRPLEPIAGGVVEASPGWRLDLVRGAPFSFAPGERLIARLAVDIDHGGGFRLASLYADVVAGG
jgi:hypothetical protein